MLIRMKKAQSLLEYTILMVIILAAFLTMQVYVKRGFQGRWKGAVDDLGEQYDPQFVDSAIRQTMVSESSTQVRSVREGGVTVTKDDIFGKKELKGSHTLRDDHTNATETREGFIRVGLDAGLWQNTDVEGSDTK